MAGLTEGLGLARGRSGARLHHDVEPEHQEGNQDDDNGETAEPPADDTLIPQQLPDDAPQQHTGISANLGRGLICGLT